jgi:hypothetical protein
MDRQGDGVEWGRWEGRWEGRRREVENPAWRRIWEIGRIPS